MKHHGSILACLACLALSSVSSASDRMMVANAERLERLSIQGAGGKASRGRVAMQFDAMGRSFDLSLEPNTALFPARARASLPDDTAVLRGRLQDDGDSWARIVLSEGRPSGLLFDGNELYAIESDASPGAGAPLMFRLADLVIEPGAMRCGAGSGGVVTGQQVVDQLVAEMAPQLARAEGAVEEIEIGAVGDSGFARANGDPQQAILTRLNNVDGIFSSELGIQVVVPVIEVFDEETDPFTDTKDADELIGELADYRFGNAEQRRLGLTHLFTERPFDATTVGIAYIDVLCNGRFGAGLTVSDGRVTTDSLIAAHEIGHNFGAEHDGDADGSCPDEPSNQYIMASRVNGNPEFSACSKSIILSNAATASCIAPLPSSDVSVTSVGQPEQVLLGNAVNLDFAVNNRGSLAADNVAVEISLPETVALTGAVATDGTCTSGAGSVSCDLGSIPGGSGVTVALSAIAESPGTASFTAVVTAVADEIAANNRDTHIVEVAPAVNLGVAQPASVDVSLNGRGSTVLTIDNRSILGATGVTALLELDAGITANSAIWTAGSCEIVGDQLVECSADSLGALSSSSLTVEVTGVLVGRQNYTVTLGSNETDADENDNVATGSFNVAAATSGSNTSGSGSGGGGAAAALLLILLGGFGARRRRLFP